MIKYQYIGSDNYLISPISKQVLSYEGDENQKAKPQDQ